VTEVKWKPANTERRKAIKNQRMPAAKLLNLTEGIIRNYRKITRKEFDDFVGRLLMAKPSKLKDRGYNPTKKELAQRFRYNRRTKQIDVLEGDE